MSTKSRKNITITESVLKNIVRGILKEFQFQSQGSVGDFGADQHKMGYGSLQKSPYYQYNQRSPLNPSMYGYRGQGDKKNSWSGNMTQRGNTRGQSYVQEIEQLDSQIQGYIKQGYFGNDQVITNVVGSFCSALRFAANRYVANMTTYDKRASQQQQMVAEAQYSVYGLGGGLEWINNLYNSVYQMYNEGCFKGGKTQRCAEEFMEILRVANQYAVAGGGKVNPFQRVTQDFKRKILAVAGTLCVLAGIVTGDGANTTTTQTQPGGGYAPVTQTVQQQAQNCTVQLQTGQRQVDQNMLQQQIQAIPQGSHVTVMVQGNNVSCRDQQGLDNGRGQDVKAKLEAMGYIVDDIQIGDASQNGENPYIQITQVNQGGGNGGGTYQLGGGQGNWQLQEAVNRAVRKAVRKVIKEGVASPLEDQSFVAWCKKNGYQWPEELRPNVLQNIYQCYQQEQAEANFTDGMRVGNRQGFRNDKGEIEWHGRNSINGWPATTSRWTPEGNQ